MMTNTETQIIPEEDQAYCVPAVLLEFDDVIDKLNHHQCAPSVMYAHITNGTIREYYDVVLDAIIYDLTVMPVARIISDHDNMDDNDTVSAGFKQITEAVGYLFNKDGHTVYQELVRRMDTYPIDDVREAYSKRHQNALH